MPYDAIIFDVDGTLWNASSRTVKGWNRGLEKLGITKKVTVQEIESVTGNPYQKCVDMLLPDMREQYPSLLQTLDDCEKEIVQVEGGIFYPGALEGMKELAKIYQLFLLSNCDEWYLHLFLEFSELKPYLTGFDCYGMSKVLKDQMLLSMKNKYSLKNPLYVGDTAGDESAAKAAKVEFIHVSYGFGTSENGARSFDSFGTLVEYLKGENKK